jgi:hypothetical protein
MAWETFKGRSRRVPGEPAITLSKAGNIGINVAILRSPIVKDAKYALFMFDRDKKLLGFKFIKERVPEAYPLKLTPRDNHGMLAATAMLKTYDIFPKETKSYLAKFDDHNKIWFIDLKDEGIGGKKKARKE